MTKADKRRVRKALQGADFPATEEDLVSYAQERGADVKTMIALRSLPAGIYDDSEEVADSVPQQPG
ncbi:DUF2795 domain-containing protein [Saccharopolyspora phatthalungensis]|uniref:DUF2795 domain-containing protein n=1 Tax=Saccharopolyspora phatthalungensis TaxID=664693 RepID=A0A840QAW0_9PSEU|nr:DUF2795 domain-containing protein [Saccharopolyspora phatthalungensis]MBB5156911.1 hypothetical protein [Saccharopolyspora phatthalungensis]